MYFISSGLVTFWGLTLVHVETAFLSNTERSTVICISLATIGIFIPYDLVQWTKDGIYLRGLLFPSAS